MIIQRGAREVTGFVASLLFAMLTGLILSFNVYAVEVKRKFDFSQTQVELIGSFAIGGMSTGVVSIIIINRYGHRTCLIVTWVMVTVSCVFMWLATQHVDFFREWIALLCVFQFILNTGIGNAQSCILAIGILQSPKRHTGKIIGLYTAFVSLGKIYYSASYRLFFQSEGGLGRFFLFVPVGFTITGAVCFLYHTAPEVDEETGELLQNSSEEPEMYSISTDDKKADKQNVSPKEYPALSQILRSSPIHLVIWPNLWFQSCGLSFMNNITSIASSLQISYPELTIYEFALGVTIARISFGIISDYYNTRLAGVVLFQICSITFGSAMFISVIWLSNVSIYIITFLASIGLGAVYSLTLGTLTSICGPHHFISISTIYSFGLSCFTFIIQIFMGMTYDYAFEILEPATFLCAECFHLTFIILLCSALLYFAVQCLNSYIIINKVS